MAIGTPVSLGVNNTTNGSGTTLAVNASTNASGKGRVVAVFAYTGNVSVSSVADTGSGLTWTVDKQVNNASNSFAIASAGTSSGWSAGNITATFSASAGIGNAAAFWVPGANPASSGYVDGTPTAATGTGTSWSAGSITITDAGSIVLAGVWGDTTGGPANTPTSPAAEFGQDDFNGGFGIDLATEYRLPGSTGSYNLAGTFNFARSIGAQIGIAYKPAPPTAPGTPGRPSVSPASATSVALSWTAPSDDGGASITGYVVTPYIGGTGQTPQSTGSTSTSYTATGLTTGTAYTFTVAATNSVGTGSESAQSNTITPEISSNTGFGDGTFGTGTFGVRSAATAAGGIVTVTRASRSTMLRR